MTTVEFLFDLDQKVKITATGETGVVSDLMLDDGGKKYYVKCAGNADWWAERLLIAFSD